MGATNFNQVQYDGDSVKVGATTTVTVLARDPSGFVLHARGTTVPSDGEAGYAIGCKFDKTNGSVATAVYFNEGSSTTCDFNAVESAASTVTGVTADVGLVGGGASGTVTVSRGLSVRNETGGTLTKGTLVYVSGYANSNYLVAKADANAATTRATLVLAADLDNNTNGTAYGVQVVTNINTDAVAAAGDPLYLSETAGQYTSVAPTNSNADVQMVGRVIVKNATTGSALFFPEFGLRSKLGSDNFQAQSVNATALDSGMFTTYGGLIKDGSSLRTGIRIYNNTGSTLVAGTLVNLSGFTGTDGVVVTRADADSGVRATHVVLSSINNLASGDVYSVGNGTNLNTNGRTIGDLVYLDATTAGSFTFTAPTGPDQMVQIVGVVKVVNATTGEIVFFPGSAHITKIPTSMYRDGSITAAKLVGSEARTATADGLTTGAITTPTSFRTFVTVTSANATDAITLPTISAGTIGQEIFLTVGANGYELLTPASSNNTINQVDSDGTNQLDVAANTTVRCTQISATGWLAETIAATTIAITAPDND